MNLFGTESLAPNRDADMCLIKNGRKSLPIIKLSLQSFVSNVVRGRDIIVNLERLDTLGVIENTQHPRKEPFQGEKFSYGFQGFLLYPKQ